MKKSVLAFFVALLLCIAIYRYCSVKCFSWLIKWQESGLLHKIRQDLFHIHGWLPNLTNPYNIYKMLHSGFLWRIRMPASLLCLNTFPMQSNDEFSVGPRSQSLFNTCKKYDFVLSTTETFEAAFFTSGVPNKPYRYDMILSNKEPSCLNAFCNDTFECRPRSAWWCRTNDHFK